MNSFPVETKSVQSPHWANFPATLFRTIDSLAGTENTTLEKKRSTYRQGHLPTPQLHQHPKPPRQNTTNLRYASNNDKHNQLQKILAMDITTIRKIELYLEMNETRLFKVPPS